MSEVKSYEVLISEYEVIDIELKEKEERKVELRNQIAELMHNHKLNDVTVESTSGMKWRCVYQESDRKSCDYELLFTSVGSDLYNQIVKTNTTTSLYIRKAPKEKASDKVSKAPKAIKTNTPRPPVGTLT